MFILSILDGTAAICIVDYDEELMDLWSSAKVTEWHTFLFLLSRDIKRHHGLITGFLNDPLRNEACIVFSFDTESCVQFLPRRKPGASYLQYFDGIEISISMPLTPCHVTEGWRHGWRLPY